MKISLPLLSSIAAHHGPSFYLLDSDRFQENFRRLQAAFRSHYPDTTIAYSYKTNYVPRYCELVMQLGGYAEVVSSMEMDLALRLGVPAQKIFFNGPYKEHGHVQALLEQGGTVNVDSWHELQRIARSADSHVGQPYRLGLRCNFDVHDDVLSRFGLDVNANEFMDVIKFIDQHPKLKLVGLHCHFAARSLNCWKHRTIGMLDVIDRHFRHRLDDLTHVSLGGGMYGHMPDELKAQFPIQVPEFEDYAGVAARPFADYFEATDSANCPTLIIEPGTALVADAMKYACQVNTIKQVRGRTVVSLTGSAYNINPNPNRKNLPIECFGDSDATKRIEVTEGYLAGYTCIEGDYLYKGFSGKVALGDFVVFDDVGSYSIVMKPPFILPNVAVVEPLEDGRTYKVIKRRETFEDIFNTYTFD